MTNREIYRFSQRLLSVEKRDCPVCHGHGVTRKRKKTCRGCGGGGTIGAYEKHKARMRALNQMRDSFRRGEIRIPNAPEHRFPSIDGY